MSRLHTHARSIAVALAVIALTGILAWHFISGERHHGMTVTAQFEDAASGAANATLAAWLAERGALPDLPGGFYRVSQGREVGHDAIIELSIDADGDVWSGGRAVAVVTGTLDWPE